MSNEPKVISLKEAPSDTEKSTVYRFDIFKGSVDQNGKVVKMKSVGSAYLRDSLRTYTIHLKTFLQDTFYLLPNTQKDRNPNADFVILTREPAQFSGRKYFWHNVGDARILDGENHGLAQLLWDVLGDGLYMNLHPVNVTELPEASRANAAA